MESLIKLEAKLLEAQVIVTGGLNNAEGTCPFEYMYIDRFQDLLAELLHYEYVLYHWLPAWAVEAVKISGIPAVEFVHRIDTAECDKNVPQVILSHSQYICNYIYENYGKKCHLVPNVVDTDYYTPSQADSKIIGAVTSYYDTKGIDILIEAWSKIEKKFPEYEFHIYGTGNQKEYYSKLARHYKSNIKLYGPLPTSKIAYDKFQLVVSASRVEGLPIALLEALSCNLPIIASDIEGHRIINEMAAKGGFPEPIQLFKNEDSDELAQQLKTFLENAPVMSVNKAREVALELFSPKRHINGILEAFYVADLYRQSKSYTPMTYVGKVEYSCSLYHVQKERALTDICFPVTITHDCYLVVKTSFFEKDAILLFDAVAKLDAYCNIYMQIDMIDGNQVSSEGEGIYWDQGTKHLCAVKQLPTKLLDSIQFVIRPNENEDIKILSVLLSKGALFKS